MWHSNKLLNLSGVIREAINSFVSRFSGVLVRRNFRAIRYLTNLLLAGLIHEGITMFLKRKFCYKDRLKITLPSVVKAQTEEKDVELSDTDVPKLN